MTQRLRQWLRTMEGINWCKWFQIDFLAQYQRRCQRLQCIDICSFTEVNGFKHLIICIDYFSKWSEAKHIKNKSVSTIGQFLYEVIRRRGCMKIQMSNHGWEFVNEVSKVLHNMIGTEKHILSAYHPQSNRLCQRQNSAMKNSLVTVLDRNPCDWANVIKGVLFAHRISKHTSSKLSSHFLMNNREPTSPIDVKYSLVGIV